MLLRRLSVLILAVMLWPSEAAAGIIPTRQQVDRWLAPLGANRTFNPDQGIDWGIMPGPFYTPELGAGVGAVVAGLYRPDPDDHISQNSSVTLSGYASSTGAFGLQVNNYGFYDQDKWRFFVQGELSDTPTWYWGKGFRAGSNNRNKQRYVAREISMMPQVMRQIASRTYFGLGWSLNNMQAGSVHDPQKNGPALEADGRGVFSSGPLISLSYDSRDFLPNPHKGISASLQYIRYSPQTGSNTRFDAWTAHFSAYHEIDKKRVLAWEINGAFTSGQVPWNMLPSLGDSDHFRGYYPGRYRERDVISTQLEYRQSLSWRNGIVGWIGSGTMASHFSAAAGQRWLPTIGAGYRFAFKPGVNIRLDYGIGKNSSAFYFQAGEAF